MNMSKSENSEHFRHIFSNNFYFGAFFQNFFNGFEISMKFWVFDAHIEFFNEKIFFSLLSTFCKL